MPPRSSFVRRGGILRGSFGRAGARGIGQRPQPTPGDDRGVGAGGVVGRLWNSSDIMPSELCHVLGMERGSTYGRAAQTMAATTAQ